MTELDVLAGPSVSYSELSVPDDGPLSTPRDAVSSDCFPTLLRTVRRPRLTSNTNVTSHLNGTIRTERKHRTSILRLWETFLRKMFFASRKEEISYYLKEPSNGNIPNGGALKES
ncbi:hypothetical protein AB6A40_010580 [Gnathostoma spinigerum]|uniref:Uncharacterized protein n=1 Tax=Gnathostoma spinigerum TaxID=75299 RepID=A0ABD6EVF7_9BILA